MEAILGDTKIWYSHLQGAASLINSASSSSKRQQGGIAAIGSTFEGRWLLRNFAYHDILMSVTMDQAPLIPGSYWIAEDEDLADSYFGLATVPMRVLSEISTINGKLSQANTSPNEQRASHLWPIVQEQFRIIENSLLTWTCPSSDDLSLVLLAETYRSAALIHLYRVQQKHTLLCPHDLSPKFSQQVSSIISSVEQMPAECLPECTLLFPLFMAGGCETVDTDQACFIRKRLVDMERFRKFQNVAAALDVLEELWRHNRVVEDVVVEAETGQSVPPPEKKMDWLDVLKRRDWKLAIS